MDLDPLVAALVPPQVTLGGTTYVGKLLSWEEWVPFAPLFAKLAANELKAHEVAALIKVYLRQVFPWRVAYLVVGDPARRIRALPLGAQLEVLQDFLAHQATSMTTASPNGTHSPTMGAARGVARTR
jgi:hypothetical protein